MTRSPGNPRRGLTGEWNHYAGEWFEGQRQQLWRRHSDAVNARMIEAWLPAGRVHRILKTDLFDEAVSEGLHKPIASRAGVVIGMDVSTRILSAVAHRHERLSCLGADVRSLPIADECIDAIVSLSTLDHFDSIDEVEDSLAEFWRILAPGGVLLLTMDNFANPVVAVRNSLPFALTHAAGLVPYPVGKTEGPSGIRRLVEDAGFVVETCTAIMHAPRVLAIPVLNMLSNFSEGVFLSAVARVLLGFERLRSVPTRFLTGHFIAIRATKV